MRVKRDWIFANAALFLACLAALPLVAAVCLGSLCWRGARRGLVSPLPETPRTAPSRTPAPFPSG